MNEGTMDQVTWNGSRVGVSLQIQTVIPDTDW